MERNDFCLVAVVAFFSLVLPRAESHISSRLGMRGRRQGRKRLAFYANDEGCAVAARCTGDGGEVTNYSSLSAALVFKGRAFHLGNQAALSVGLEDTPIPPLLRISRPSYKPAATMLTTSFRHIVKDLSRPKLWITLLSPPKSL